jgi:group I intron endonuclease
MGIIYKITCSDNGKVYVGQTTKTLSERWAKHQVDIRTRKLALHNALRKYGVDRFKVEVIEECDSARLNEREIAWISTLKSADHDYGYNRTAGGNSPLTAEIRKRISEGKKGAKNPMFGVSPSAEVRAKISKAQKGRVAPNRGKSFPRCNNRMLTVQGVTLTISEWGRRNGVDAGVIGSRIKAGWSVERAVSTKSGEWPRGLSKEQIAAAFRSHYRDGISQKELAGTLGVGSPMLRVAIAKLAREYVADAAKRGAYDADRVRLILKEYGEVCRSAAMGASGDVGPTDMDAAVSEWMRGNARGEALASAVCRTGRSYDLLLIALSAAGYVRPGGAHSRRLIPVATIDAALAAYKPGATVGGHADRLGMGWHTLAKRLRVAGVLGELVDGIEVRLPNDVVDEALARVGRDGRRNGCVRVLTSPRFKNRIDAVSTPQNLATGARAT